MKTIYENISIRYKKTDDIFFDIINFLKEYGQNKTIEHSLNVAEKGIELASIYQEDKHKIKLASYFHDISVIIPNNEKIEFAKVLDIEIVEEEKIFPMIIHQKLSKVIAQKIFKINDIEILNAIECHTTLKANPSKLDMILFIADKIKWDQEGDPPYLTIIESHLKISLEKGAEAFINYLMENKNKLRVIHPMLIDAYNYFRNK
jgi:predicted HD superfamily hydrolase involved in NAD metabolism